MNTPLDPRPPHRPTDRIERLIDDVLRAQPLCRAPRTLQARVFAEIERRASLPWWQRSFLHWPLPARGLFVLASLGIAKFALLAVVRLVSGVSSDPVVDTIAKPLTWAETGADLLSKTFSLAGAVLNAIPTPWLYGGIALAATLYIALVALGATAYRTLYVNK